MARSVADIALCFSALTHSKPALPAIDKPRIGFYRTLQWDKADAATQAALEDAASRLAKAGARVCLHGAAADMLVAEGVGPLGLTASELIDGARSLMNEATRKPANR